MKFFFSKIHGELKGSGFSAYLKNCKDGFFEVTIKRIYNQRTLLENDYMWGCVYTTLSKELGYEPDEIHSIFTGMFLTKEYTLKKGLVKKVIRSTTELTTIEFEEYMQNIRDFSLSELSIVIPLPDKNYKINQK